MIISRKTRWLSAVVLGLLTACGGGGGDSSPDYVDQVIASQLNFEGVYADESGLTLELKAGVATIRALGSSDIGLKGLMKIGEEFVKSVVRQGPDRWTGYIATVNNFIKNDPNSLVVFWENGSATIQNKVLSITDGAGKVRTFKYIGASWTAPAPSTPPAPSPAPGTQAPSPAPVAPAPGDKVQSALNLEGARKSKRVFNIDIAPGTTFLQVTLSEAAGGRQLADLFVRRGAEAVIIDEPQPYSWTADCAKVEPNRITEVCTFNNPPAGRYFITVYGYHEYWGADLKITWR